MPRAANRKKRPDGNYVKQITIGRKPDGKPIRKTFYAKTIKEIERIAAEYERQMRHGTLSSNENATFGELAEIWLRDCNPMIGKNTRKGYAALLNLHLLPELSGYKLKELKALHLQGIINGLAEDGYSEKTLRD